MEQINYEQKVKKIYPEAFCSGVSVTPTGKNVAYMIVGCGLGENYNDTKLLAWESAYNNILNSQKTNNE